MQICNKAADQWERGPNDRSDCDASYIYAPATFFLRIRPLRCGGPNAAQALFDGFSPHSKNASREWLEGKARANTWWALQWSKVVPFVARCRLIDGSMFHVQALIALFSGTEAPWVANEWTRGVRWCGG